MRGPAREDPVAAGGWEGLRFQGEWRRYQRLALDAFDADRAGRRRSTHVVAPPGSGKTVIGLEIARRLGRPALVLCPTAAIQAQWPAKLALFGTTTAPLQALTYQAVCQTSDPDGALHAAARRRLAAERSADTGAPAHEVLAELDTYTGAAARRLARDTARVVTVVKREIARGEHPDLRLADLLSDTAAARVAALRAAGTGTVVFDECHHLVSLWGYLVRAIVDELGDDVHVVGLTATSPDGLTGEEAELYAGLLGEVDFTIPTPAVVKEGHLAPFQELALFSTPLDSELAWLRERHVRFAELLDRLHDPAPAGEEELGFPNWVIGRLRHRDTPGGDQLSFAAFARRHPALARAGLRYLHAGGLAVPRDAPRGEGYTEPLDLDDWLVMLDDWALRCLSAHPGETADGLLDRLAVGLADLGYALTRRGIRPGRSDIDRVLVHSAAKPLLVCEALDAERAARGDRLRAVVLCDTEDAPRQPEDSPLILSGGALGLLEAIGADARLAGLRPVAATGRTVACLADDAPALLAALRAELAPDVAGRLEAMPHAVRASTGLHDGLARGLCAVSAEHAAWRTATYVPALTRLFARGDVAVLVGTRGLLGEGWDCPEANVLVDCTSVAASISVRQLRGRSLRLDPGDERKLASNWDVVCVAPELERGLADYRRFARRHSHLHAPCEDGSIESGVSHVHPELSPYAPPPAGLFAALNAAALARAAEPDPARERWRIGAPYRGADLPVLLVNRPGEPPSDAEEAAPPPVDTLPAARLPGAGGALGWLAASTAGGGLAVAAAGATAGLAVLPVAAGLLAGGRRRAAAREAIGLRALALERAARAVLDAYVELGELGGAAAASLSFTPRLGGHVRCALTDGSAEENARFSDALAEALGEVAAHRYLVGRPLVPGPAGAWRRLGRGMVGRDDAATRLHPVPPDLGRNRARAEIYLRAWRRWVAPEAELTYTRDMAAPASLHASPYTCHRRTLWV